MTLIFLQTKFETVPPKNEGGAAFLAKVDASCQILDFCRNNIFPVAPMALILKFLESQHRKLTNMYTITPTDILFSGYGQICNNVS